MPEKLYISWDEFHRHTRELAQKLKANNYSKIVAVSRGGCLCQGYSRRLAGFPLGLNKLYYTLCLRMFA